VGRNDPCTCGSGKKYKKCCGFNVQPELVPEASSEASAEGAPANPLFPGMDPNSIDPQWLAQMSQMLNRLPKGQMQKLNSLMQKAMSGKDVSREADALEKSLPMELQSLLTQAPEMPDLAGGEAAVEGTPEAAEKQSKLGKTWRKMFGKR
jgi:hypothetical protein